MNGDEARETVLVVEDDPRVLRLEREVLEREGYTTLEAQDGEQALTTIVHKTPSLVLLDLYLPRLDGFTVCRRVREFSQVPIIVVTAKGSDEDKIRGFDAGADDYVTKPFSVNELVARVKAVLRRARPAADDQQLEPLLQVNQLTIDFAKNRVTMAGADVALTATEHRLLAYLARNAGRILTPDQILASVWGEGYEGEANLLRVTVARLRHKLGDDAKDPRYVVTRPGIGYSLAK